MRVLEWLVLLPLWRRVISDERWHVPAAAGTGIAWVIIIIIIISVASGGGGDDDGETVSGEPTTRTVTPTPGPEPLDVPAVDCEPLFSQEEVDAALGWSIGDDRAGPIQIARGEVCLQRLLNNQDVFVQIQPGEPGDFEPGSVLVGVPGEPVPGVGDEALWFGGEGSEAGGDAGALSVRQDTSLGALHFQIFLGRPDLDSAAQREIAKTLALNALPRFPGVEPEVVKPEPFDRSEVSYDDNLLVKEEAGEWTRGEGLVATLRLFAGEIDATQVLRHSELIDYSGTGVVQLAREYLETGPEEEARTEIARLLALVAPSIERLKQEGAIASSEANAGLRLVSLGPVFQEQPDEEELEEALHDPTRVKELLGGPEWCAQVYGPLSPSPCMLLVDTPKLPSKYELWRPASGAGDDWTDTKDIDLIREAMFKSAEVFEPLGEMPPVVVLLLPWDTVILSLQDDGTCQLQFPPSIIGDGTDKGVVNQRVALQLASCLILGTFGGPGWWGPGLAMFLSGVVEKDTNLEHKFSNPLSNEELSTTLMDRSFTNWALFEAMFSFGVEVEAIFSLVEGLPSSAKPYFHSFELALTDNALQDIGSGKVPYDPMAWSLQISGPTTLPLAPSPFGVRRLHATVDPGKIACLSTFEIGNVEASWAQGIPGDVGSWHTNVPRMIEGESVFLVTTADPGALLDIEVTKVFDPEEDEEGCEDPTPTPTPPPEEGQAGDGDCIGGGGGGGGAEDAGPLCPSGYYWPLVIEGVDF